MRRALQVAVGFQRMREAERSGARPAEFAHDFRQGHDAAGERKQAEEGQSPGQGGAEGALATAGNPGLQRGRRGAGLPQRGGIRAPPRPAVG